jgi:hypothetical protein
MCPVGHAQITHAPHTISHDNFYTYESLFVRCVATLFQLQRLIRKYGEFEMIGWKKAIISTLAWKI